MRPARNLERGAVPPRLAVLEGVDDRERTKSDPKGVCVEENHPPATDRVLEDRVRELGFDPRQLTPREREELVEIYSRCPDEVLTASAR